MRKCLVLLVLGLVGAPAPAAAAEPPAGPSLTTCLAADADSKAIWPTDTFPASGKQMFCVFQLGKDESFEKLTARWTAVDVGDAAPANTRIAQGDVLLGKGRAGKFRYVQPGPLPVGKYRLDVLADGKPWKSAELNVAADPKPADVKSPAQLFPLVEGKTWSYRFVQEPGPGGRVSAPGEKIDPDGALRATVTLTLGKAEDAGTAVRLERNGKPVAQEWWTLDASGLSATRRKTGDEVLALDPPQPLLPLTRESYRAWTYAPKDRSFTQTGQLWALKIKGPSGEKPGYLTVMEQATPLGKTTVERHFIPDVGLVREVVTATAGPRLLSRQTMTLVAPQP